MRDAGQLPSDRLVQTTLNFEFRALPGLVRVTRECRRVSPKVAVANGV